MLTTPEKSGNYYLRNKRYTNSSNGTKDRALQVPLGKLRLARSLTRRRSEWLPRRITLLSRRPRIRVAPCFPPSDVDAHPQGASPFGVMDMVGNVWQWTDEYLDDHTAGAIIRGGSHYQPQGSIWYLPQAYKNDQHGKLLMMASSYDRSGTLGFRCVKDEQ